MIIQYTYKIINVDTTARAMEILYVSEGRQTMHIGARLPFEGETIETIVKMYSPIVYWEEQEKTCVIPEVGVGGTIIQETSGTIIQETTE
jgi:hypothetical protein